MATITTTAPRRERLTSILTPAHGRIRILCPRTGALLASVDPATRQRYDAEGRPLYVHGPAIAAGPQPVPRWHEAEED